MSTRKSFFIVTMLLAALTLPAQQTTDYDITSFYLDNAGFDSDFDYTIDDTGNVAQEILDVKGWVKDITVDYTITGVYQIGTHKTFNGAPVPSTGYDGTTDGGVLALSTGWSQSMLFYQKVELPAGHYALVTTFWNGAENTAGRSRVAWMPTGGTLLFSELSGFPTGEWVADTIRFELTTSAKGKIQIGFQADAAKASSNFAKPCLDFVKLLRDAPIGKADLDIYKLQLQSALDEARKLYGDGSGNDASDLAAAIDAAQSVMDDDNATKEQVDSSVAALETAMDTYLWANPTGGIPTVTTDSRYARGATMAFGRMRYSGIAANQVQEAGFCWSEAPEPTIHDQRTTRHLTNNGNIYWLDELTPATRYYMRAYVITKGRQVGYGDVIRFYTIPKGQIRLSMRGSDDAAADSRIQTAAETAITWWNNLTEMKGFTPSVGYTPGVPTADCSYGGWIRVGSNQSYQRAGTIMHEMLHGVGVIPWADTEWSRFNLRAGTSNAAGFTTGSGLWLGDRVTEVLRFWDNSTTEQLNGDYQHLWPYGINGASEDNGSDLLYIGNSLVCQALGEDGLQHTSSLFAEPYHAFNHEEDVKYYLKNEDGDRGLLTSLLMPDEAGKLVWRAMTSDEAAANDSCAWYITFTPSNQYYQLRNAATGQYMSTVGSSIRTSTHAAATANDNFQFMRSRINVGDTQLRGYWLVHPNSSWTPSCLQANANGATAAATFDIANAATTQRWLILTADELTSLSASMLAEMRSQVLSKMEQVEALAAVPHSEDAEGTDAALSSTLESIRQRVDAATSTSDLQVLLDDLSTAAFQFLANATPTDAAQPFDLTYMVQNPTMDATDGWSDTPTISYSCAEYYERTFDFHQVVSGLPAGTYQVRVQGFQRPGSAAECSSRQTTAYVYGGAKSQRLAHITSDAQTTKQGGNESSVGGKYFPNNMQAASIYFKHGYYENSVTTEVGMDGGELKLGIRCSSMPNYYWCIFDNFRLCYFGSLTPSEVDGICPPTTVQPTIAKPGIYTLDGRKVSVDSSHLPAGLYIIDGKKTVVGGF